MNRDLYLKNLSVPGGRIDVLLDTDAYNEIDDQYAISYLLFSPEKVNLRAITAAPFLNAKSTSPEDGMEKSYREVLKVMKIAGKEGACPVYRGSGKYLPDDATPVESEAARKIVEISRDYSAENPLYIVAIGAITNVASALLIDPDLKERSVVVWLGGHARSNPDTKEFNMKQDFAAARVVFGCGVPFVQIPCRGVASEAEVGEEFLRRNLAGTTPIAEYLMQNTIDEVRSYTNNPNWRRVIWDATAVAYLLDPTFTDSEVVPAPIPSDEGVYLDDPKGHPIRIVTKVYPERIFADLFQKISK